MTETENCIKLKLDQSCGGTESSDDFFSDGETRTSLQSVAKSSSGYHSGSSTDISETVQPVKSMIVCGTIAASRSHDLEQVDEMVLGSIELTDNCKWPNLGTGILTFSCVCALLDLNCNL